MTKTDAAAALGVSARALERYASAGRLPSRYVRGKTGQVLDFDGADVEHFKAELAAPVENVRQAPTEAPSTALARLDEASLDGSGPERADVRALLLALGEAVKGAMSEAGKGAPPVVPVADKLLLTLAEAQALTGLSRAALRAAIEAGALPARRIGRARRLKRADLEQWIETL